MERPAMVATGVPQLDTILGGGIVEHSMLLLCGPPGSGKTVLASQIMAAAVERGESVLFVTVFAEPQVKLITHLRSFSFFRPAMLGNPLKLLNLQHPLQTSLDAAADTLVREAHEHRARMVVLDGLGGVLLAGNDALAPYRFLYNISAKLGLLGTTMLMTLDLPPGAELQHPELVAIDSLVALAYERDAGMLRSLRVVKHRGAAPLPGRHRFRIGEDGLQCFARLESLPRPDEVRVSQARAAFGVPALDAAMGGGPNLGSSTLLCSPAHIAVPLGLRWLLAGRAAKQRGYLISLREPAARLLEHDATGASQAADDGQLVLRGYRPAELLPDQLAHELLNELTGGAAWRVAIDGSGELAPLLAAEGRQRTFWAALLAELRARGATTLLLDQRRGAASELAGLLDNMVRIRQHRDTAQCSVRSMRFSTFDGAAVALDG